MSSEFKPEQQLNSADNVSDSSSVAMSMALEAQSHMQEQSIGRASSLGNRNDATSQSQTLEIPPLNFHNTNPANAEGGDRRRGQAQSHGETPNAEAPSRGTGTPNAEAPGRGSDKPNAEAPLRGDLRQGGRQLNTLGDKENPIDGGIHPRRDLIQGGRLNSEKPEPGDRDHRKPNMIGEPPADRKPGDKPEQGDRDHRKPNMIGEPPADRKPGSKLEPGEKPTPNTNDKTDRLRALSDAIRDFKNSDGRNSEFLFRQMQLRNQFRDK